ncbi:hypothetical protein EGW08_017781 [Elysia chlorotica]|uniref:Uncharacterized protein n=1 Tax=Elysia chlorotica TaxID=188477 RepID=A0A433SYT4_ELYCH|nr:hypothetical protein EGW08_017781 [Elysia chlorotica]
MNDAAPRHHLPIDQSAGAYSPDHAHSDRKAGPSGCVDWSSLRKTRYGHGAPGVGGLVGLTPNISTIWALLRTGPKTGVRQFYIVPHTRQGADTMTRVSVGHINLTPTQPVGSQIARARTTIPYVGVLPQGYHAPPTLAAGFSAPYPIHVAGGWVGSAVSVTAEGARLMNPSVRPGSSPQLHLRFLLHGVRGGSGAEALVRPVVEIWVGLQMVGWHAILTRYVCEMAAVGSRSGVSHPSLPLISRQQWNTWSHLKEPVGHWDSPITQRRQQCRSCYSQSSVYGADSRLQSIAEISIGVVLGT